MTQAPTPRPAMKATSPSPRKQPTSVQQTTLWKTLEEGLRTQLAKHLAELIRRVRESQALLKGGRDERL